MFMPLSKMRHFLFLSVLAVPLVAQEAPPPAAVEIAEVIEEGVAETLWAPGTVVSREDSRIASEVAGVLTAVVEVGERVTVGQVLATINQHQLKLQQRHNRAELERLQARLRYAQRQLERTESLAESNSTAQFRLDELAMERDVLKQEIILAQVALEQTDYLLTRSRIVAPFDGVVAERFHQPGEHIGVGEELLRLVNIDELEISLRAPASVHAHIAPGDDVTIKSPSRLEASQIRSVIPVGDPRSRMLEVRVALGGDWVVGDAVSVALTNGEERVATLVPRDALVLRDNMVYVFRVDQEGKSQRVTVEPGIGKGDKIAVVADVRAGDRVVTRGAERLRDGQAVRILNTVAGR